MNLVDWGTNDRIAVALKNAVYLYDVDRAFVTPLDVIPTFESPRLHASALKWIGDVSIDSPLRGNIIELTPLLRDQLSLGGIDEATSPSMTPPQSKRSSNIQVI